MYVSLCYVMAIFVCVQDNKDDPEFESDLVFIKNSRNLEFSI